MRVSELYELKNRFAITGAFFGTYNPSMPNFLSSEYFKKYEILDNIIVKKYADFELLKRQFKPISEFTIDDVTEWLTAFRNDFKSWSVYYGYKYQGLYDTTQFDYNPIENYNRTEHTTESMEYGTQSENMNMTQGARSGESTDFVVPFDSSTESKTNRNSNSTSAASDSSARIIAQHDDDKTIDSTISGNIGVMSTQDMIGQQRSILDFNALDELMHGFFEFECLQYYS